MNEALKNIFPQGLKGIVFDCDGVMIDSAAANRYLYNTILGAMGLAAMTHEQEKYAFQATFRQALRWLIPESRHGEIENVCRSVIDYDKDILPKIKLMPGYGLFLEKARQNGLGLAMDTNRTRIGARKILDFFNLPQYFNPIISCEDAAPKPSPEGPEKICSVWGASPCQALFVGDSANDRSAAKGAGMIFAGFGGLEGDIAVNSWEYLAALLWGG